MLKHRGSRSNSVGLILSLLVLYGCGSQPRSNVDTSVNDYHPSHLNEITASESSALKAAFAEDNTCRAGSDAFTETVFPFVRDRCVGCHNGAIERAPPFAAADVTRSYPVVLSRMNFDDMASSTFVRVGGNMHCQTYGVNCATNTADVMNVVSAWWEQGEKDCPRKGKFFTEAVLMPATLPPRETGFMPVRLRLNNINPAFANAFFEMEAQLFAAATPLTPGAYRFRAPRLVTTDKNIHIGNVKVLINGKFSPSANAFIPIDRVIAAQPMPTAAMPLPHPVLSSKSLIVAQEQATGDSLSVSFEALEETTIPVCRSLLTFQQKVLPVVAVRNCQACHGGANNPGRAPANQRFNMNLDNAALCAAFLQRADLRTPMNSPIIDYALRGTNQHPRIIPQLGEIAPSWTDWIVSERSQNFDDLVFGDIE